VINGCHTDNGTFASEAFMEELVQTKQAIHFSGIGAAHQNGVAERGIKTTAQMARTSMIHSAVRAPDLVAQDLWPMAMNHAVWLHNRIPRMDSGLSPLELWSKSAACNITDLLRNVHVWGCPVFVLEPELQKSSSVKIPKWALCSCQALNMGFSCFHASTVALILNLVTKSITAQFHAVFDGANF